MKTISVETTINAPIEKVWEYWNGPEHVTGWAFASDDWEAPAAENDLRVGGKFKTTMAAKDKSASFDFTGLYTAVKEYQLIEYDIDDGRHVRAEFTKVPGGVKVVETFDPENENPEEMQRSGWQSLKVNPHWQQCPEFAMSFAISCQQSQFGPGFLRLQRIK